MARRKRGDEIRHPSWGDAVTGFQPFPAETANPLAPAHGRIGGDAQGYRCTHQKLERQGGPPICAVTLHVLALGSCVNARAVATAAASRI